MVKNGKERRFFNLDYNFYILNSDLSVLTSLKRILRRELYNSELSGSITVRSTLNFIESLNSLSSNDVFIVELDMLSNEDIAEKVADFSKESTVIILLNDKYNEGLINELVDRGITKYIKIRDFNVKLITEYIFNKINRSEAKYYLEKTDFHLSDDLEIETLKVEKDLPNVKISKIEENIEMDEVEKIVSKNKIKDKIMTYKKSKAKTNEIATISTAGKRHINIWGDYQFGCELAYILSKQIPLKILLIDSNRLAPSIDMYFGIEKFSKSYEINDDSSYNTGLNIAIDAIRKNVLTKELIYDIAQSHKKIKNLFFLSGSYNINNYEYYDSKSYIDLISICKDSFDLVITLSNDNIYDLFTSLSIIKSDINIIPMQAHYDNIRKMNNQVSFLVDKQNISLEKNYIVPFEYMKGIDVGLDYLNELSICKSISKISFSKSRRLHRNKSKCFVEKIEKKQELEYQKIIKELGYI